MAESGVDKFLHSFALDIGKRFLIICQMSVQLRIIHENPSDVRINISQGFLYLPVAAAILGEIPITEVIADDPL